MKVCSPSTFAVRLLCGFSIVFLKAMPVHASEVPDQCYLFSDGVQALERDHRVVSALKPTLARCTFVSGSISGSTPGTWIATRQMSIGKIDYQLIVESEKLLTRVVRKSCLKCEAATLSNLNNTRFAAAVARLDLGDATAKMIVNPGLRRGENADKGAWLTADLCPSLKPLDRAFLSVVAREQATPAPLPIALSVAGSWLKQHLDDFQWLKEEVNARRLSITWVNHSYRHTFDPEKPEAETFMKTPGLNLEGEILRTEKALIENGVTPSIFFRFPGLISDPKLLRLMRENAVVVLGADAWLAIGQKPTDQSIILVHANGNEPLGLAKFKKLSGAHKIPLPLRPLLEAIQN